jgi:hypothetical protein
LILVRGRFRLDLSVASTTLEKKDDYADWGPGIAAWWPARSLGWHVDRAASIPVVPKPVGSSQRIPLCRQWADVPGGC